MEVGFGLVCFGFVSVLSCGNGKKAKERRGRGREACHEFFWHVEEEEHSLFPYFLILFWLPISYSPSRSLSVDDGFGGGAYNGIREPKRLYNYCLLI